MEQALAEIAILAGGFAAGHVLIRLGYLATHKMRSAFHRPGMSDNSNPQPYYQSMERSNYPYYQPSGYHYRR